MSHKRLHRSRARSLRGAEAAAALVVATVLGGCESLLEVEAPSRVQAEDLQTPAAAALLVQSAVGDFDCALASYVTTAGQVVDELMGVHIYSAEAFDYDRRTVDPTRQQYAAGECGNYGAIYQPLSTAIWQADNILTQLETYTDEQVPDRAGLIQTAAAYAGYGRVLLGESFCTAAIGMGSELGPDEIFGQAEALFTRAIGGPDPQIATMARLGRARVRLNLGNGPGAAEDARQVPEGFVHYARYSDASSRSQNEVYNRNNRVHGVSVGPNYRNPTFKGMVDPRVQAVNTGDIGSDGVNVVWVQQKYASLNASIPIARWEEAQLIIAEVEGGQTAADIINVLHDRVGLPEYDPATDGSIPDHVIQERARELFLEGHRFWDFRRFELPFDPPVGAPYQHKGGFYGDMRCFPLPNLERDNNPNID